MPDLPGSSPHMRGTPTVTAPGMELHGIIPAYAGNTHADSARICSRGDHPRICGEHLVPRSIISLTEGSSPHMRGTRGVEGVHHRSRGIIPAYAGNTRSTQARDTPPWDHPRICGEHSRRSMRMTWFSGSSPHMRGTLGRSVDDLRSDGIIPAYAGNTPSCTR